MNWKRHGIFLALMLLVGMGVLQVGAEPSHSPMLAPFGTAFTYQGYIEDEGSPANGTYNFRFSLWDDPAGGTQVGGTLTETGVPVAAGYFTVVLDFGSIFDGTALWLAIEVQGPGDPGYTTLSPRQPLTPVPYAINADTLDGLDAGDFASLLHDHVGESWSTSEIITLSLSNSNTAGRGLIASSTAVTGAGRGVEGYAYASGGRGISGINQATSGSAVGTYGETSSSSGYGVFGFSVDGTGTGGQSQAENGTGIYGTATGSGSSVGVSGSSDGSQGQGVSGFASSTTGFARGVYGYSASSGGFGVYGFSPSTGNHGVGGESQAVDGRGVYGNAYRITLTGVNYGVYGRSNSSGGYGGFFVNDDSSGQGYLLAANDAMSTTDLEFKVSNNGNVYADGRYYCGQASSCFNTGTGADVAERIDTLDVLEPGDVVEIDIHGNGLFNQVDTAYSPLVAGVISSSPGVTLGNLYDPDAEDWDDDRPMLALTGRVPVKVSAENGPIQPGDLLVSSSTPGHAMRCEGIELCYGRVIGKALEPLNSGMGIIEMLVMLQ